MFTESYYWLPASGIFLLAVLMLCGFMFYMMRCRCKTRNYTSALEKAADFIGNGLVFFGVDDRLVLANVQAHEFLPDLLENKGKRLSGEPLNLQDFLIYFYDMAVECDESLINTLGRSAMTNTDIGFREVIMTAGNRLCLVEVQKIPHVGTNLILIDVGDLKNQEDYLLKLNHYNHELTQAIQAATSGIVVTKQDHVSGLQRIVFANKAFCEDMHLSRDDILGKNVHEVFATIVDAKTMEKIYQISEGHEDGSVELSILCSGGEKCCGACWYELKHTSVQGYTGKLDLSIWLLNDMTALKMREAELSKTQKLEALGQLAAGVAHDFNNILSIIDGYARIAGKNWDDKARAMDDLDRIRTASRRGANLIKKMLTFSRHEIVDDTVIDLGAVVREQELLLRPLLDASVKCSVLIDHQEMYVECPIENITQIIMNLVLNARDVMPDGGVLLLEVRACPQKTLPAVLLKQNSDKSYASIIVSDTGMGMPKDVVDRIFDPFFTTKEQGKGTGLGLSMVYGLVKQIGGHIDVFSTLGQGTTMSVYLPLSDKVPKKILGGEDNLSSIRFDGYSVLVAEDEPDLLALVSNMLEDLGMKVLRASNGNEALAVQDDYEGKIDLLLTDVVMPELNGVDLADLLKELRPDVNVIFMSGYPAKGQMARVEIPEDAVFIAKPIEYDALVKVIYTILSSGVGESIEDSVQISRWASKGGIEKEEERF